MKGLTCLDRNLRLDDEMSIDIRYADDTTLVSAVFEKLQIATSELENACHKWGLKINPLKYAVLTTDKNDIKIGNNIVPKVNQFKFLGSLVPNYQEYVLHRISIASQAFGRLRETIWTSSDVSRKLKIRLYKALILPIAIYGSETWTMRKQEVNSLLVFEMKCLRAILRVTKYDRLTNTNIRKSLNVTETIEEVIIKRQLRWFGHVARSRDMINSSYKLDFKNPRPRGRPLKRWADGIRENSVIPLLTLERRAADRDAYKKQVFVCAARGRQVLRN